MSSAKGKNYGTVPLAKKTTTSKPPAQAKKRPAKPALIEHKVEMVAVEKLIQHPNNYRTHPDDQILHLEASLKKHGVYRNIVVAKDDTILAGHGIVAAAQKIGMKTIPVIRLNLSPNDPAALKVLTGDNEMAKLAMVDDRALTELLMQIKEKDLDGLLGTGFDEQQLTALLMLTRPQSEIENKNDSAAWAGLPGYDPGGDCLKLIVSFRNETDREQFCKKNELKMKLKTGSTWSTWWPDKENDDVRAVRFEKAAA